MIQVLVFQSVSPVWETKVVPSGAHKIQKLARTVLDEPVNVSGKMNLLSVDILNDFILLSFWNFHRPNFM